MKRTKLITNLCLLILSLACLTFGVYSAVKTTFTASGTITFNAYGLELDVKCTISGLKDGATKTLYGTTFLDSANVNNSTRTNYVSSSAILVDDTHFNLSASGATMNLGELAFDELSEERNKITIKFEFWNYSNYMVKAEALTTVGAEDKLVYTPGGAAIMNQYTATEADASVDSDYGWFPIEIFTEEGATAISSSENSISIAITVSPEGLSTKTESGTTTVYDSSIVKTPSSYDDANYFDGMVYTLSTTKNEAELPSIYDEEEGYGQFRLPYCKETLNMATSVFGKNITKVSMDVGDGFIYGRDFVKLSLPAMLSGGFSMTTYDYLKSLVLPSGVTSFYIQYFSNLEHLILQEGLQYLSVQFSDFSKLSSLIVPTTLTSFDEDGWSGIDAFFTIKNGAKYLTDATGKKVLYKAENTSITSCIIDENTRLILPSAFSNCNSLTSITIPSSVSYIGYSAFNACDNIATIICNSKDVGGEEIGLYMYFTPTGGTKQDEPCNYWYAGTGVYTST